MGSSARAALLNELIKARCRKPKLLQAALAAAAPPAAAPQPLTASSASIDGYVFGNRYVFGDLPPGLAD